MKMITALALSAAVALSAPSDAQRYLARQQIPIGRTGPAAPAAPAQPSWVGCANDFGTCRFNGPSQIRYGVPGVFIFTTVAGTGTNVFYCHPDSFNGVDPAVGTVKTCYYDANTATSAGR